jgi:hypothetical protein
MQSSSLQEYRLVYPQTSSEPNLTQTGGLAFILARIEMKRRRLEQRQLRIRNARQSLERIAHDIAAFILHTRPRAITPRPQLRPSLA